MIEFVQEAFSLDHPMYVVESALLSFTRTYWWTKRAVGPAWKLMRAWRLREPIEMRNPASPQDLKAVMSTFLAWGYGAAAIAIWLCFHAMLRPQELLSLRRRDLVFLYEEMGRIGRTLALVKIAKPKTRRIGPRVQHVICEEKRLVIILKEYVQFFGEDDILFPWTRASLLMLLYQAQATIGIPRAFPTSGLRAGGTTYLWIISRNFQLVRLRGRWVDPRTLEHYIQEAAYFMGETRGDVEACYRVTTLARMASYLMSSWVRAWARLGRRELWGSSSA
jgi:hypothetical protein